MPVATTLSGGSKQAHALSTTERQAALHALSKLGSSYSATLSGGTKVTAKAEGLKLLSGSDTFVGGAASRSIVASGVKTAVAGSFGTVSKGATAHASADTINVAGHTASTVKADESAATKSASKITLSDKTTVTLHGIPTHNLIKPH